MPSVICTRKARGLDRLTPVSAFHCSALHLFALMLCVFGITSAVAAPSSDVIDRPRLEDPFEPVTALHSEDLWFGYNPRFQTTYTGDDDVIARSGSIQVTERDLFCFLLASGYPWPGLYEGFQQAKSPREGQRARRVLEKAIAGYILTERLSQRDQSGFAAFDQKVAEVLTFPAWQAAWTMRVIEPELMLREIDAVHEYRTNDALYYLSPQARARILYVPFEAPEAPAAEDLDVLPAAERADLIESYRRELNELREQAVARLDEVRLEVAEGRLTFAEAERAYSGAPAVNQSGLLPPFQRGELAPQLEDAIFGTPPGEFTPVVPLPSGAAFAQVDWLQPERFMSYEQARDVALEQARQKAARFSFEERLDFISDWRQRSDTRTWDKLEDSETIVKVGDFQLSKREILALFPTIENTELFDLDRGVLEVQAEWLAMSAHVRRLARQAGLESDPIVRRSAEIAEKIVRARRALRQELSEQYPSTTEEARQFHDAHPEMFRPAPLYHIVHLYAGTQPEVPVARRAEVSRRLVESFILTARLESERADIQLEDPFETVWYDLAIGTGLIQAPKYRDDESNVYDYNAPKRRFPFTPLVPYFRTPQAEIYVEDLGWVLADEIAVLEDVVGGTEPGEFTAVRTIGDTAHAWYVLNVQQPAPVAFEMMEPYAARELALRERALYLSRLLDMHADPDSIDYFFGD